MSLKQRINRLRREVAPPEDQSRVVVFVYGDPEPPRLLGRSLSSREAMIGNEVFETLDGESEGQFHRRLGKIARERRSENGVTIISVGDDEPQPVCRYNLDGTLITVN